MSCNVCQRRCLIPEGQTGFCQTRVNKNGSIVSLLYGLTSGIQIDPIEKKPFYHYKPGSLVATLGSYGCNFRCRQCLNYHHSWGALIPADNKKISPVILANEIAAAGYHGIAFSFNEPVLWYEFARDIAQEFKKEKKNNFAVFVTNGSWTKETVDKIAPHIDAANIDLKGFSESTYQKQGAFFGEIPPLAVYAQKKGIFLELTTLLIPTINDNPEELKKMTAWMVKNLGPDTPWHLSQFDPTLAPDKEFKKLPLTPVEKLQKASEIGKKEGLNHIYIWAPSDHFAVSDTLCPKCHKTVIKRSGWKVQEINITSSNQCRFCNYRLNVRL